MNKLFGNSINLTQKSLDYLWKRQGIINENIANQDTPGYKTKYLTFEDELKQKAGNVKENTKKNYAQVIEKTNFKINRPENESVRMDENNVNTDAEYVELARTNIQYQYSIRAISDEFARLRSVIKGQ